MAVTRTGYSIVMTAVNDVVNDRVCLDSLSLVGTNMTAGQRLTVSDKNGSTILGDHYVLNTNENAEFLLQERKWANGLKLTAVPAAGTWTVIARLR